MVNTVKLLLIAQQSGLEVVEQEGHRTPLRPDDSPRPLIHRSLSELGLCPWLLGMSPRGDFPMWPCREQCGLPPPLGGET